MSTQQSRARSVVSKLRRRWSGRSAARPAGQSAPSAADAAIIAAGIVDLDWYAFETGRTFDTQIEAIRHWRRHGNRLGLSLNPLFVKNAIPDVPAGSTSLDVLLADPSLQRKHPPFQSLSTPHHLWLDEEGDDHPAGAWGALASRLTPDTDVWVDLLKERDVLRWGQLEPVWRDLVSQWNQARAIAPAAARTSPPRRPADSSRPTVAPDDQPLVSVVVAAQRCDPKALRRSLASVQAQRWSAWEIVLVDDGTSGDGSIVWSVLADRDQRIRVVPTETGPRSQLLNLGLTEARGAYVAFIDADHTWSEDHLELVVGQLLRDDSAAAFSVLEVITDDGPKFRPAEAPAGSLLHQDRVDLTALVVRMDVARRSRFDESLPHAFGHDFALQVASHAVLAGVPAVTVRRDDRTDDDDDAAEDEEPTPDHPPTWTDVVRVKHLVHWQDLAARETEPGLVSVVISMRSSTRFVLGQIRAVWSAFRESERPWEVVVVDHSQGRAVIAMIAPLIAEGAPVRYVRIPSRSSFAVATDVGLTRAHGEFVVCVDDDIRIDARSLTTLVETLAATDGPALLQPVIVDRRNVIVTAGAVFGPRHDLPAALLGGHLAGDTLGLGVEPFDLDSADGRVVAMRFRDLVALGGLDPIFDRELDVADLGLRLRAAHPDARVAVLPESTMLRRLDGRIPTNAVTTRREFAARHASTTSPTDPRTWSRWDTEVVGWERRTKDTHAIRPVLRGTSALRWAWVMDQNITDGALMAWLRSIRVALAGLGDHCTVHAAESAVHPRDELLDVIVAVGTTVDLPEGGQCTTIRWFDETRDSLPPTEADLSRAARTLPCGTLPSAEPASVDAAPASAGRILVVGDPHRWKLFDKAVRGRRLLIVGESWRRPWYEPGDLDEDEQAAFDLVDWIPWPRTSEEWAALVRAADEVIVVHEREAEADDAISPAAVDALVLRGEVLSNITADAPWSAGIRHFVTPDELAARLTESTAPIAADERRRLWDSTSPERRARELRADVLALIADGGRA